MTTQRLSLQRQPANHPKSSEVPPIVHEVLHSPGQSLDGATRAFFEPRFGHDFSQVRVHCNSLADESSRALNASAYTYGKNIVFSQEQYAPGTEAGQLLLGHELAHVVQQGDAPGNSDEINFPSAGSDSERIAEESAKAIQQGRQFQQKFGFVSRQSLFLQALPAPVAPPFRPPVRPPLRSIPGGRLSEAPERLGAPNPSDMTLEEILERVKITQDRERAIWDLERPRATLDRGGKPPNFITEEGEGDAIGNYGQVRYRRRAFHVLDAIEYEVGRANSDNDLSNILGKYMPSWRDPHYRPGIVPLPGIFPNIFVIPSNMDPDGNIRMRVYAAAVDARISQNPRLGRARSVPGKGTSETRRRRCAVQPRSARGGDPLASIFCQEATGSPFEYEITSPTMGSVVIDAMVGDTIYECKCGYGSLLKALDKGRFWARFREDKLDEQMLRQRRVAADCGLKYRYVVSNRKFADFLRDRWPDVQVIEHPWDPCD